MIHHKANANEILAQVLYIFQHEIIISFFNNPVAGALFRSKKAKTFSFILNKDLLALCRSYTDFGVFVVPAQTRYPSDLIGVMSHPDEIIFFY